MMLSMERLNENIFHLYNKWKEGYTRKENSFKQRVHIFLSNRENADIFEISKDGKYLNVSGDVKITDDDIQDGEFIVPFGEVKGDFNCSIRTSLKSLKGAPEKISGSFKCTDCTSLTSLEGAPKKVGWDFFCGGCTLLTSLEGAPEKVNGNFSCGSCTSLKSLKGAPKTVGMIFSCDGCTSLTSLEGAPEEVGLFFDCKKCTSLTSLEGLPKLIEGNLYIDEDFFDKIPDYVVIKGSVKYE